MSSKVGEIVCTYYKGDGTCGIRDEFQRLLAEAQERGSSTTRLMQIQNKVPSHGTEVTRTNKKGITRTFVLCNFAEGGQGYTRAMREMSNCDEYKRGKRHLPFMRG